MRTASLALVLVLLSGCSTGEVSEDVPVEPLSADPLVNTIALPGGDTFPNGVAVDPSSGNFFTGSTEDGTVLRGDVDDPAGEIEVFLEPGTDDRDGVYGMRVDGRGRLFMAGGPSSTAYAYDTFSGELLASLEDPDGSTIGDIAVTDEAAYFTSSGTTLFRVPLTAEGVGELERWVDLRQADVGYEEGANIDGIAATADGRYLLTVQQTAGDLWRVDTTDGEFERVDLGDQVVEGANGLILDGTTLYAANTDADEIMRIELADDLRTGEVLDALDATTLNRPTSVAVDGGHLLVANHQVFGEPVDLPFELSILAIR